MPKTIWLIRHAENSKDEATGLGLTKQGIKSAQLLARKIAGLDSAAPTLILTSLVRRGLETGDLLRQEFSAVAKPAVLRPNLDMGARNIREFVGLINYLKELDHDPDAPQSVILIGHKQNDALQLLSAMLDTEGFATDYRIKESARRPAEKLYELINMDESDMAALYPEITRPLKEYAFLEAMMFRLPEKWADFKLGCARHERTLAL